MYTLTQDNNIIRIRLIKQARNEDRVTVCTILSPEDETRSLWGQIHFDLHVSEIFENHEDAKKAAFIGRLSNA